LVSKQQQLGEHPYAVLNALELAKIEAEIDREIERDRKRPHKLMLKSKPRPPWTSPPE
jgi:hypothetical protein